MFNRLTVGILVSAPDVGVRVKILRISYSDPCGHLKPASEVGSE